MKDLNPISITLNACLDILLGVSVGDAMGVPVEFKSRDVIKNRPVTDMIGYGTYNLPPGTFSDDSSLTFCLAEALISGYDLNIIADNFIKWLRNKYWTATNVVFDVGITTRNAIERLIKGFDPGVSGEFDEESNGNGSLMRILPLLLYIRNRPIAERYQLTRQVSSITHGHVRSSIACFYYLEFARGLLQGTDKFKIYEQLQTTIPNFLDGQSINPREKDIFQRLFIDRIDLIPREKISSSGYVVSTLQASIWCLLTTESYEEAVLKAVNLGSDTDTTGAVTGGLAGLLYGHETIPANWLQQLARKDDIEDLAGRLYNSLSNSG